MSSSNSSNSYTETAPNTDKPFQLFSEDGEADGSDGEFEDAESQERDQETDNGTVSEDEPADEHANDGNISEHESNADTEEQVGNQRNENRPRNQQPNGNKRKKRQSWVWDHFRIGRNGKPRCRVGRCSKEYGAKSATATLAYHLLKKHSIHPPAKETEESNETTPTPSKKQSLFQPPLSHFLVFHQAQKKQTCLLQTDQPKNSGNDWLGHDALQRSSWKRIQKTSALLSSWLCASSSRYFQ